MKTIKVIIQIFSSILLLIAMYFWLYLFELAISAFCFLIIIILDSLLMIFDRKIIKKLDRNNQELTEKLRKYEELEQNN